MVIKQEMIAFIDKVMNQKYIWIMKYLILILILAITNQSFALSEQEEFELYKEFKAQKASESSSQNQSDTSNDDADTQKEVNVYITNSNDSKTDSGNQFNQKAFYYYENQKKSLGTAGAFAFFIPTAGHAYAGNWLRGLPFLLFEAVGVGMMSDAVSYGEEECYYSYYYSYCEEEEIIDEDQYVLGLGILVVAKIWEVFDARATAKNYNEDLKRGLNLVFTVDPRYNLVSGIQYNF